MFLTRRQKTTLATTQTRVITWFVSPNSSKWIPLTRGLRKLCPQCGLTPIFQNWGVARKKCENCGCQIRSRESDCWFFMYMTTAFITGIFLIIMLLVKPENEALGRTAIAIGALLTIVFTVPRRKGLAIAIDYLIDSRLENPRHGTQE